MNKKLLSLAVAAALVAPAAAMADATLYGKLNISLDWFDVKGGGLNGWTMDGTNGEGADRANRVGVKGSEDLGGGLKAIYQIEFGIAAVNEGDDAIANGDKGNAVKMRNTFVGLAGGWGTFLMGRHDTPMKISTAKLDLFADTVADYNGTVGFQDIRADNAVAYISPNFSGFTFAGAIIPGGGATATGVYNVNSDHLAGAFSLAGIYSNGPFYGSLAYEQLGKQILAVTNPLTGGVVAAPDTFDKWRVGLGILDWNGFTLDGIYENWGGNDVYENDLWQIQAAYAFGNAQIKAMYGQQDPNVLDNQDAWAVGLDYNFSKRTKIYAIYTSVNVDNNSPNDVGDWDAFSLGMMHSF